MQESAIHEGATVVISHRIRADAHAAYEAWLEEIAPRCKRAPGHLDWHIVRPISGLSETFTIVIRFDTEAHLRGWMSSAERTQLIERARPLLLSGDDFFVSSGLDFWFTPSGAKAQVPVRYKQFLITWSAIFPLSLAVPLAVVPLMAALGLPDYRPLTSLAVSGVVVFLMVYVVMPRYTKLVRRWLFQ